MLRVCLSTLSGAYAVGLFATLPGPETAAVVAGLALLCLWPRKCRLVAAFLTGWLLSWTAASSMLGQQLAPEFRNQTIAATVRIADFSRKSGESLQFLATVIGNPELPGKLRLSWISPVQVPDPGETWALELRLRPPRGFSNPAGFDYEGWLFRNGIGATGYVVSGRKIDAGLPAMPQLRRRLNDRLERLLPVDDAGAVLAAISVGARHKISPDSWARYARTGTSHLMAISGLHIGLAGGAVLAVAWGLLSIFLPRANVRSIAIAVSLPCVGGYALLSGFAVPAQRASLMLLLAAVGVLAGRPTLPLRQLAMACLLCLAANPLVIWAPGFQLSFAAVFILISIARNSPAATGTSRNRFPVRLYSGVCKLWRIQIALLLGLFAITATSFGRAALVAPLVNLIVLPVFGLCTVPLSLLGLLLDGSLQEVGDWLLRIAYASTRLVLFVVESADRIAIAVAPVTAMSGFSVIIAATTALHVLLPAAWPGRNLAWIALVAVLLNRPVPPPSQCMDLVVLDVGQGLTALLRTANHSIVFDTGPAFRGGNDTASLVTIPYLTSQTIDQVDLLVVSHADLDHAGGVESLLRSKTVMRVIAGESWSGAPAMTEPCRRGQVWSFDDLRLSVIHPRVDSAWTGNNASCVLLASFGANRILLTGDIESVVERMIAPDLPTVAAVLVPHHGSNTSSVSEFVSALRPDVAIVSAGFGNRWGFPRPSVAARWRSVGAELAVTATDGAVTQRFCLNRPAGALQRNRRVMQRFWTSRSEH